MGNFEILSFRPVPAVLHSSERPSNWKLARKSHHMMQTSHAVPLLNLLTITKAGDWILVARATIRAAITGRSTLTQFINGPAFGNQHTGLE